VLPHSVFALPFAVVGYLLALKTGRTAGQWPLVAEFIIMILAVVFARTAAMSFNRYLDADFDLRNPRTANREIPKGIISKQNVLLILIISTALFFASAWMLGVHCLIASPVVMFVLLGYSYLKRFTKYSHMVLGLALALAPGGAWWVVRPEVESLPLVLMFTVLFWVAGFDIIYSCQDVKFDREHQLFSIPAKLGTIRALHLSKLLHWISAVGFILVGMIAGLNLIYFIGAVVIIVVLLRQHRLITPSDFSKANRAFFTFNGVISIAYLVTVMLSLLGA
jgi:4-hydroxybenzoate polyprenyltransferase